MIYQKLARPVLFRLGGGDAERAHQASLRVLAGATPVLRRKPVYSPPGAAREVFGIRFPNPVGLAAGMDKDGVALDAWPALGFGFVEVGTVTRYPQPGNPRPRLFRLPEREALVNRMGFNNAGAAALAQRLAQQRRRGPRRVPLGVSIGKSKVTPIEEAAPDYLESLRLLRGHADYVAINVSSPNTPGLRGLQDRPALTGLLRALRCEAGGTPLLVKIAPDLTDRAIAEAVEVCEQIGVAGIIATNTTVTPEGGLSGRPLAQRSHEVVAFIGKQTALPVVAVGGIMAADDARRLFDAGASLVQLLTGLVYKGPSLVRAVARGR
ncbi:MAG: quinone-dependent dihydroorotate dehydrogenase [Micromonosporaceae bacterium]|nr:quinone-dependent dihydroorotate dehydrogenase [Micromonosporaceae bacterium]